MKQPSSVTKRYFQGSKGFTLLELIIVVVIIGIIAAFAIPAYFKYIDKAKVTVSIATLDTMRKSLESYYDDYRSYPATIDFTTGQDGMSRSVFPQRVVDDINEDFSSIDSYVVANASYTLVVTANNSAQTVLTLTPNNISH